MQRKPRLTLQLMANAPNYFTAFMKLLACNFSPNKALLPSEWQTAVLGTASALDAPYEWDVNAPVAELLPGWTQDTFQAIRTLDTDSRHLTRRQRLIVQLVKEVASSNRASDQTMADMQTCFTPAEILEVFYVHGIYGMLAKTMNSCHIDFDEPIEGLSAMLAQTFAHDIERERTAHR